MGSVFGGTDLVIEAGAAELFKQDIAVMWGICDGLARGEKLEVGKGIIEGIIWPEGEIGIGSGEGEDYEEDEDVAGAGAHLE